MHQGLEMVKEAFDTQIGGYDPPNRDDFLAFVTDLPQMFRDQGQALHDLAERMSDRHVSKEWVDKIRELSSVAAGVGSAGDEQHHTSQQTHDFWQD